MEYKNFNQIPMYPEYGFDDADELDRDVEYMKELYPQAVRAIQQEVDEECDKLEYEGSCMFDEFPCSEHLNTIIDAIYDRIMASYPEDMGDSTQQFAPLRQPTDSDPRPQGNNRPPMNNRPPVDNRPPMNSRPPMGNRPPMGPGPVRPPRPDFRPDGNPDWLRGLVSSLLFNEMLHRRRRFRRRRRPFRNY